MADMYHGWPCWFELMTPDLGAARSFYADLFGWQVSDAGMPGSTYLLAKSGEEMVAGLMAPAEAGQPCFWMLYLAVEDIDAQVARIRAAGGGVHKEPADIPGTGRFAVVVDPQGAPFGLLQPLPMETPPDSGAFDQQKAGHGNWIELQTSDPAAAMAFYADQFGWRADASMPMGAAGSYDLFAHRGAQIGGMMKLAEAPAPFWLPYFGVDDVAATLAKLTARGGRVLNGPVEVPGPALVAQLADPQGVAFAVVGPKPD